MKRTVSIFLCLILSLLMITACAAESNAGIPEQAEPSGAGSATAKVEGFGGVVTVNITVEDGTITELTFSGKGETKEYGGEAMTALQALVVENNSTDVDTVAGATITSKAFLQACRQALGEIAASSADAGQAALSGSATAKVEGFGGVITVNITVEDGTITELTFSGKGETKEYGGEAMTALQALVVENNSVDVDTVAGATITSKAFLEACGLALAEIEAASMAETEALSGSATAKVEGFGGVITVNITVEDGKITELTFVGKGETKEYGGEAMITLQALVIENNSTDVDTVAGATITSKAFLEACRQALAEIAAN